MQLAPSKVNRRNLTAFKVDYIKYKPEQITVMAKSKTEAKEMVAGMKETHEVTKVKPNNDSAILAWKKRA